MAGGYHCLFKPRDFLEMTSYQAQVSVTAVKEFSMKVSKEREVGFFLLLESREIVRKAHAKARNMNQTWRKIEKLASQSIPHERM